MCIGHLCLTSRRLTTLMDTSIDNELLSNPESEDFDKTHLTLTRLGPNNLTAKWGHGNSVSLFNVAKRTDKPNFNKKLTSNGDSTVLAFSWDNILVARQVSRIFGLV